MGYKKTIIFLMFTIFIFSITVVSASDMNDTAINSDDTSQMELTASNEMDVDNLQLSEENTTLVYANNVESEGEEIDSAVLSDDTGNYSSLFEEIGHGGNIKLKHAYYSYDTGSTINIIVDNSVIDGRGAVIDMAGSNIRAFTVSAFGVIIKNLTIKNADPKYGGNGGTIYFYHNGSVINCNFTNNTAHHVHHSGAVFFNREGTVSYCNFADNDALYGAVYFTSTGSVTYCKFINNTANYRGGAVYFKSNGKVANCNFTNNFAYSDGGGAVYFRNVGAVVNCNFSKNSATYGGAIYFFNQSTVTNCNFTDNALTF